jgi:hypothetical protein
VSARSDAEPAEARSDPSGARGPEPRYGAWFWAGVAVGWAAIAFGVVSALTHRGATQPVTLAVWVVGLALVHDLLFAPLVLGAAWLLHRAVPRVALGIAMGALVVSGLVVLYSIPFVARWGAQADNPSLLPHDVGVGVVEVLALVWLVAAAMLVVRLLRDREADP